MTRSFAPEPETLTIHIPFQFKRRGGRKLVFDPSGKPLESGAEPAVDTTLIKTLVKAHRWRRRIESGQAKSVTDLAEQEKVTDAYVRRLLPLTCMAPDIAMAILDGRQPKRLTAAEMLREVPMGRAESEVGDGICVASRGKSSSRSGRG